MDQLDQPRLFRLAVEAVTVSAHFDMGRGWHVAITARRGDETWQEATQEVYDCLSSSELVDVLCASLSLQLGL